MKLDVFKNPTYYEESDNQYWNDPIISKNLLKAHLSDHLDNASRNVQFMDASFAYVKTLIDKYQIQSVCDLGCGPGFYCEAFYKMGLKVTGIDISKNSLENAKEQAKIKNMNITYRHENYLEMDDKKQYDFLTLIYCEYGSLSYEHRQKLLNNMYQSLKENGVVLFDVFSAQKYLEFKENSTWSLKETGFWHDKPHLELLRKINYGDYITLDQVFIITESIKKINRWMHYFTPQMLISEVEDAGFKVKHILSDVRGKEYDSSSNTIALVLKKESL